MERFITEHIALIILAAIILPLIAFLIQLTFGNLLPRKGDWLSIGLSFCSFCLSVLLAVFAIRQFDINFQRILVIPWIEFANIHIDLTMFCNFQSVLMLVAVTFASLVTQIVSLSIPDKNSHYASHFAYASLLTFAVLCILLVDNLLVLFLFMNLTSVSSYLLLGNYSQDELSERESVKMFIMNQIGDSALLVGIIILFSQIKIFTLPDIIFAIGHERLPSNLLTISGMCLFGGVIGKTALFPLFVWLNGVSYKPIMGNALVFAAGNVASGIFFLLKVYPIFTPPVLIIMFYVGIITVIAGSTAAIIHTGMEKIAANVSVSSAGFMIAAMGMGIYSPVVLCLIVHIFCISCFFLCAGNVVQELGSGDIREMGGLRKKLPLTFLIFLFAAVSFAGVPLSAGFIGKNMILYNAFLLSMVNRSYVLPAIVGFASIALTSFYLFRLIILVFLKKSKQEEKFAGIREFPKYMTAPLLLFCLLMFYLFYTFPSLNPLYFEKSWFMQALNKSLSLISQSNPYAEQSISVQAPWYYLVLGLHLLMVLTGILTAYLIYYWEWIFNGFRLNQFQGLRRMVDSGFYLNEFYDKIIVQSIKLLSRQLTWFNEHLVKTIEYVIKTPILIISLLSKYFEENVVSAAISFLANRIVWTGKVLSLVHNGHLQNYIIILLFGIILIMIFVLV